MSEWKINPNTIHNNGGSDLVISPQRWPLKQVTMVDGGAWRCNICGFFGEHYMSLHAAQQAGGQHMLVTHGMEKVNVRVGEGVGDE